MKKILVILLCALGLPIAMSAQQQERKAGNMPNVMRTVRTVDGKINAPAKVATMPDNVAVNNITHNSAEVTWDGNGTKVRYREYVENYFWDFEEGAEGWTMIDADGDGHNWLHIADEGNKSHSGIGVMASFSYDHVTKSPLTPNNWFVSPEVALDGTLTFWAVGQDPSYAAEHFAVYASTGDPTNTASFVEIMPETVATGEMTEYTVDLTAYAGQKGYIAFRHFNVTDMFRLNIDDVAITNKWKNISNVTNPYVIGPLQPETKYEVQIGNSDGWTESVRFTTLKLPPAGLTKQEVGEDYATIGWTGNGETSWNVRYRKSIGNSFWDFECGAEGWTMIDADGDGHSWEFQPDGYKSHSGFGVMTSFSFKNNNIGPLTPDNWLVSPEVALDGTLTFWAVGQDPSYAAEHFAVYASTGDPTNTASFVEIMPETVATGEITEYTVDLTAYAGQKGHIAFRHFNVTDMFALNIDDVFIYIGPDYEWTVVEGVTENPYTIEGLESGTDYDFQVQAIGEAGDVSKWSETLTFTTAGTNAIVEVASETATDNVWYNINGARLNGKPTQKGIYILNGNKVIVK